MSNVDLLDIAILITKTSPNTPTLGLVPRKALLERFMDLLLGHWSGEYDIHGLGVLRGDNWSGSLVHRTEQSISGGRACHGRYGRAGPFHPLYPQPRPP